MSAKTSLHQRKHRIKFYGNTSQKLVIHRYYRGTIFFCGYDKKMRNNLFLPSLCIKHRTKASVDICSDVFTVSSLLA